MAPYQAKLFKCIRRTLKQSRAFRHLLCSSVGSSSPVIVPFMCGRFLEGCFEVRSIHEMRANILDEKPRNNSDETQKEPLFLPFFLLSFSPLSRRPSSCIMVISNHSNALRGQSTSAFNDRTHGDRDDLRGS